MQTYPRYKTDSFQYGTKNKDEYKGTLQDTIKQIIFTGFRLHAIYFGQFQRADKPSLFRCTCTVSCVP